MAQQACTALTRIDRLRTDLVQTYQTHARQCARRRAGLVGYNLASIKATAQPERILWRPT